MVFIYALLLHSNKYYIGKTNNPNFRIENHFNSNGSEWTTKYKPITVIELIPNCDDYDEDKYTKKYMDIYGIDNVRGGSFVQFVLNDETRRILGHMNKGTHDKCFKCGGKGHYANRCEREKEWEYESSEDEYDSEDEYEVWECEYCDDIFETKKETIIHETKYCKKRKFKANKSEYKYDNNLIYSENENKCKCFRCGRYGHYASSCYSTKHINGNYLKSQYSNNFSLFLY